MELCRRQLVFASLKRTSKNEVQQVRLRASAKWFHEGAKVSKRAAVAP
jgi:hypothetical protein